MMKLKVSAYTPGQCLGDYTILGSEYTNGRSCYQVRCVCGKLKTLRTDTLKTLKHKGCGCTLLRRDKHLWFSWHDMCRRCSDPKRKAYARYGGRGISVCAAWASFDAFEQWALVSGYQNGLTIDRIDNDGNYCPENCQWVLKSENSRHKSTTKLNTESVLEIRKQLKLGSELKPLALRFGVGITQISRIKHNQRWSDV